MLLQRVSLLLAAWSAAAALAGCAGIPADLGREEARELAAERGVEVAGDADRIVGELMAAPLSADDAVAIAMLRNPRVEAAFARLGFAAADVYEAGRLGNPRFDAAWLDSDEAGTADQITFGLAQSFTDLLLLRARSRLARGEFERARQVAAGDILALAADVKGGYYDLAGAEQIAAMRAAVARAARVSADLAERYFDAGNISRLELILQRAAASEARLRLLDAQTDTVRRRTRLNRLLGLPVDAEFTLAAGLPEPPDADETLATLLDTADASRLDLAAQRGEVALAVDDLGIHRHYRWLGAFGDVELGAKRERETDGSTLEGPTLALEIPVFNQNADAVTRAETDLALAQARLKTLEIDVGNAVRLAYAQMNLDRERLEEHREALVPLREEIVARTREQVNFMLMDPFDLLSAQRQEYDAYQGYLEAVRDYWRDRAELERAVGRTLPVEPDTGRIDANDVTAPARRNPLPPASQRVDAASPDPGHGDET